MKKNDLKKYSIFLLTIVMTIVFFLFTKNIVWGSNSVITQVKISVCGNGIKEGGEDCDNNDFSGYSCINYGFNSGNLSCDIDCSVLTSNCKNVIPSSGGGGGGALPVSITGINISGQAFPMSKVTILKDGQIAATTIADPDANFSVQLTGLSAGMYNISVYGTDNQQRRSNLFNFSVFVNTGAVTTIGSIFITPTISVDKIEVKQGDNIAIFGQTIPLAKVTIRINSEQEFIEQINSDKNGIYLLNFDTLTLEKGQHLTASKSSKNGKISNLSKTVAFKVGEKNINQQPDISGKSLSGDVNDDMQVNLVDFSVVAYWYKRQNPPATVDLNGDGQVTLVDFSILAYHWTG